MRQVARKALPKLESEAVDRLLRRGGRLDGPERVDQRLATIWLAPRSNTASRQTCLCLGISRTPLSSCTSSALRTRNS